MLRRASAADLSAIAALIAAHPMQLLAQDEAWLARIAADRASRVMVWDTGSGCDGFAVIEAAWPQVVTLVNLALAKPGRGEGRQLIAATLDLAFTEMQAHRLFCDVVHDNPAALAAFRHAGLVQEGTFRQCWLRPDGHWADCHGLAILADEWRALRA